MNGKTLSRIATSFNTDGDCTVIGGEEAHGERYEVVSLGSFLLLNGKGLQNFWAGSDPTPTQRPIRHKDAHNFHRPSCIRQGATWVASNSIVRQSCAEQCMVVKTQSPSALCSIYFLGKSFEISILP